MTRGNRQGNNAFAEGLAYDDNMYGNAAIKVPHLRMLHGGVAGEAPYSPLGAKVMQGMSIEFYDKVSMCFQAIQRGV